MPGDRLDHDVGAGVDFDHPTGGHDSVERGERVANGPTARSNDVLDGVIGHIEPCVVDDPADVLSHLLGAEQG